MKIIPCLRSTTDQSLDDLYNNSISARREGQPIMKLKELEPDWGRYNAWRASLRNEPYQKWRKRMMQKQLWQQ